MKIAAVNWKLREIAREEEFYDHLNELLDRCRGCDIIVLPELFGIELLNIYPVSQESEIPSRLSPYWDRIKLHFDSWWRDNCPSSTIIVGGSNISRGAFDNLVCCYNRSPLISNDICIANAKHILTEWEKSIGIKPGGPGQLYRPSSLVGVTICLDAEFPASGRALAEAGMLFQCVPAWTETMHGFRRVRWACQARAVENQVCVIHSSLVGRVGNEECHGSSAIICPPHLPFPLDPILAETPIDEEGVAIAEVDPNDLLKCREMGEVRNWRDRDAGDWTVTVV